MMKKPKYFELKSQANNTIWLNLFIFNIKQAGIFLIVHTTAFNNKPSTLQIFVKQANIFLLRKHLKKRKKNDPDRFSLYRCKHFFLFSNNPHTTVPFKKSIKTLLFLQLLQLQPSRHQNNVLPHNFFWRFHWFKKCKHHNLFQDFLNF